MKSSNAAVLAILNAIGTVQVFRADLYTFTLKNGTVLRYTDADRDLVVSGNTFLCGPNIQRSRTKQTVGTSVDNMQVTIFDDGRTVISGKPIIQQFRVGLFRGATLKVEKLFLLDWNDTSPGAVPWFEGTVSEPSCDHISVNFQCKSMVAMLNTQMPEDIYQGTCNNQLFDAVCGASEAAFTFASGTTATSVVDRKKFTLSGTSQANGYFALGKVKFLTGANAGQPARTIKSYIGGVIEVFQPFPFDIANGDQVSVTAGCDKVYDSANGCGKFGRKTSGFNATPFIPVPETAVEGGGVGGSGSNAGSQGGFGGMVGSGTTAGRRPNTYQN